MKLKSSLLLILLLTVAVVSAQNKEEPEYLKISQKLELRGLVHTRYQLFQDESKNDGFDLRRARLDLRGDVAPKIGFRLHVELANTPKILDAVFTYKPYEYLNINIGQSKPTFCYDNLYSPWNLLTISRTQLDNALAFRENDLYGNQNGRDLGLWVSGKINRGNAETKRPFLDYTLGIYNGAGINAAENNQNKDIGGSFGISPVKNLWLFGRFYTGHGQTTAEPGVNTDRTRVGGNISYTYKKWLCETEYLKGTDKSDSLSKLERNGFYITLGYTPIKDKLQIIARFDNYDSNSQAAIANSTINKYVLGGNWFFSKYTRIQIEYDLVREEDVQVDNNVLAIQFQAAF